MLRNNDTNRALNVSRDTGLLLAGILGNLTDRLIRPPGFMRGHVVDFLQLPNFAIFNVADTERLVIAKLEDDGASSSQAEKFAAQLDISASFGLYIVLIGALVATVAGVLVYMQSRRTS